MFNQTTRDERWGVWYVKQCLDKNIPHKIIITETEGERCPMCGNEVTNPNHVEYCYKCGQRLKY